MARVDPTQTYHHFLRFAEQLSRHGRKAKSMLNQRYYYNRCVTALVDPTSDGFDQGARSLAPEAASIPTRKG